MKALARPLSIAGLAPGLHMAKVLIPLPSRDFDPTEVAVSWSVLKRLGHTVAFATPDGKAGQADDMMITGQGLDFWGFLPGLKRLTLVGRLMRANAEARRDYAAMQQDAAFKTPLSWRQAHREDFDGLLLPGGHRARGMREYLESEVLQKLVAEFFAAGLPVAAICHGVLLAARSRTPDGSHSVLFGRRTTALTWALERAGWQVGRILRFWDPNYYRTYVDGPGQPLGYMSVQQEVTRALARPQDFLDVPADAPDYRRKTGGLIRDTFDDDRAAFVVCDGNYVSARWPGDAHSFARLFAAVLSERAG
ncbi:MAG TPA: type 1 glutamine amidotransferase domain-containing protein [Xanthobacteraceae bacterium]|nr:type 1 glutamine amidotransferase domain-containing protein [Xanthobacteraceae bacterium]